jgi:hypothetical protein
MTTMFNNRNTITDALADIEQQLNAALLRHAEASQRRDEAAEAMRNTTLKKAALEKKRAEILSRPIGMAETLAQVEIEIADLDDRIAETRLALRTAQPTIVAAAVEVNALRQEARSCLQAAIEPLRSEQVQVFEVAARDLRNSGAIIASLEGLTGVMPILRFQIVHPVNGNDLGHQRPDVDAGAMVHQWRTLAAALREAATIQAPPTMKAEPEAEAQPAPAPSPALPPAPTGPISRLREMLVVTAAKPSAPVPAEPTEPYRVQSR